MKKPAEVSSRVVAGDVRVEVEPDTLDRVLVGAVRRQEVELDATAPVAHPRLDLTAPVDHIVVEHHMDLPCAGVAPQQGLE